MNQQYINNFNLYYDQPVLMSVVHQRVGVDEGEDHGQKEYSHKLHLDFVTLVSKKTGMKIT